MNISSKEYYTSWREIHLANETLPRVTSYRFLIKHVIINTYGFSCISPCSASRLSFFSSSCKTLPTGRVKHSISITLKPSSLQPVSLQTIVMSSSPSSSAAETAGKWLGYARTNLAPIWFTALNIYTEPGGSAEKELGKIKCVTIKYAGLLTQRTQPLPSLWAIHSY